MPHSAVLRSRLPSLPYSYSAPGTRIQEKCLPSNFPWPIADPIFQTVAIGVNRQIGANRGDSSKSPKINSRPCGVCGKGLRFFAMLVKDLPR